MLVKITWQFLPIIMEIYQMIISSLLDNTWQLHRSESCLWTLWHFLLGGTSVFNTPWSHISLNSALKLICFRCNHAMLFHTWIFPKSLFFFLNSRPYSTCICISQPLCSGRIWHKVNFQVKFNRFEFRVFLLD